MNTKPISFTEYVRDYLKQYDQGLITERELYSAICSAAMEPVAGVTIPKPDGEEEV